MRYTKSTAYMTHAEWKQLMREYVEQFAAETRSRERRPGPMVCIPFAVPVKPLYDGDYG